MAYSYRRKSNYGRRRRPTRRRAAPRRRTYRKKTYGSSRTSLMSKQLAVYRNPFSVATATPKIPDGKCLQSTGQRFQYVQEYTNAPTDGMKMTFLLTPMIGMGCVVLNTALYPTTPVAMHYSNHANLQASADVGGETTTFTQTNDEIAMWRLVSQGLRLSLTNNADANDGWWESCRLQVTHDPIQYRVFTNSDGTQVDVGPGGYFNLDLDKLVEHSSYRTGKLRDIHKVMFKLKPHMNDHQFIRMQGETNCSPQQTGTFLKEDNSSYRNLLDQQLDDTFDAVVIRIHGRAASTDATRILAHLVSNQEIVYEQGTSLSRFQSKTEAYPGQVQSAKAAVNRDMSSATPIDSMST